MKRTSPCLVAAIVLSACAFAACGGSTPSGQGGGGAGTTSTTSTSSTTSAAPITACSDIQAAICFSNLDCSAAADRCENRGTRVDPVPAAAPGPRGAGKGNDPCQTELDCENGVCVFINDTGVRSPTCSSDADCSAPLPYCYALNPDFGKGQFCLPF